MKRILTGLFALALASTPVLAARNGSGTYSVPHSAISGGVISSSDYNDNFTDVGSEITNSLPRDGQAGMTGQFKASSGSTSAPGLSFTSDPDTGFSRSDSGEVTFSSDGNSVFTMSATGLSFFPVGSTMLWWKETCPTKWVALEGQAVSRTTYASVFTLLSTTYGIGNGSTTFNLPNTKGKFIRGWDHAAAVDPDAASRTDRGDGTTGDHVGTNQTDAFEDHTHDIDVSLSVSGTCTGCLASSAGTDNIADTGSGTTTISGINTNNRTVNSTGSLSDATETASGSVSTETRPTNINVLYCMYAGV